MAGMVCDRRKRLMEEAFDAAAEPIELSVEMEMPQTVHAFVHGMDAIFCETAEAVLNVFQQAHGAISRWWWSQRTR